jgi:hypothetical protein
LIAIGILLLSVMALIEFAVSQWRSMWMTVASQPLSDCLQTATGISAEAISENDFDFLLNTTQKLCGEGANSHWMKEVQLYYKVIRAVESFAAKNVPALAEWTKSELVSCSRFAAAILDEHLNANLALANGSQAS